MFNERLETLHKAVDRIASQLEQADEQMKEYLTDELIGLQILGEEVVADWAQLDHRIRALMATYHLLKDSRQGISDLIAIKNQLSSETTNGAPSDPIASTVDAPFSLTESEQDFESAVFGDVRQMDVHFRKGLAYYDLFMFRNAIESLEQVLAVTESPLARLYLAAAYVQEKQVQKAQSHLSEAKKWGRDPLFTCGVLEVEAQLAWTTGDVRQATRSLLQTIQYLPDLEDAWYNLAICHMETGRLSDAHESARQVIRLNPTDPEAHCLYGQVQLRRGNLLASLEACVSGLKLQPRHRGLLMLYAVIAQTRGEVEACVRSCRTVLTQDPAYEPALTLLVHALLQKGHGRQAMTILKKDLSLHPARSTSLLQLGVVTLLVGDLAKAERVLLQCLAFHDDKSLIWISLGKVSALRGDCTQAMRRFLRAMKDPRPAIKRLALFLHGQLLDHNGQPEEARQYLRAASALGSDSIVILDALASNAERLGDWPVAQKLQKQVEKLAHRPENQ